MPPFDERRLRPAVQKLLGQLDLPRYLAPGGVPLAALAEDVPGLIDAAVTGLASEQYVDDAVADLASEQYVDDALAALPGIPRLAAGDVVGDGSASSLTFTHNLDSTDVLVQLQDPDGGGGSDLVGFQPAGLLFGPDTVEIDFGAPVANGKAYRVLVVAPPA